MCGSLAAPANGDLVIPLLSLDTNDNPTCQQLYEIAMAEVPASDKGCPAIMAHKDFCGCPGASTVPLDNCSLCPDGEPANYDSKTYFNDTCGELDIYIRFLPQDLCDTERVAEMKRTAAFCGCPGVKADCYMCSGEKNTTPLPGLCCLILVPLSVGLS